ncbi:MAG: dipeptidyl carboxypeptidase II, partial [Rhodanobacteraceae bacterium]
MMRTRGLAMAMGLALFSAGGFCGDAFAKVDAANKLPASNPFADVSALPFHAPAFDKIKFADYAPAFAEGMRVHLIEIDAIAVDPAAPTVDNTIVAMERSGALLTRVAKV